VTSVAENSGARIESKLTLAQTWHAYLRSVAPELRPRTLGSYRGSMQNHVLPALGHVTLAELTRERIHGFINAQLAAGVSPKTVRNSVGVIRSALGGLVSNGVLQSNPASIRRGWLPVEPRHPRTLTKTQLRRFLRASTGDRYEALILFLALSGVRLGEALALRWCEVDLEARTAIIRRPVSLHRREMPTIRFGFRTIDLAGPLVAALTRHRVESQDADLVFRGGRLGGCVNARHVHQACRSVAKRAGLPIVSPHVLRHTWATTLLEAGVPVSYVSCSLGHSSTAFTAALYASARPGPLPGDKGALAGSAAAIDSVRRTLGDSARAALDPRSLAARAMMVSARP
jgi:integrase